MADSSLDRKASLEENTPKERRITGSLALRVLIVSLVFLVIPLLSYTFYMYRQEYKIQTNDLFQELELIAKGRERLIEKLIELCRQNLGSIEILLDLPEKGPSDPADPALSKSFGTIAKDLGLSSLFYLKKTVDGSYVYSASSFPEMVGKELFFENELQAILNQGVRVFLREDPNTHDKQLYVLKVIHDKATDASIGMLGLSMLAEEMINDLATVQDTPYPYNLSFVTKEGELFVSSHKDVFLTQMAIFSPEDIEKADEGNKHHPIFGNEEALLKQNKEFLALKVPIEKTEFFLLVDVPEDVIKEMQAKEIVFRISTLLFFIVVLGGGGTLWVTMRMAKPLKSLYRVMDRVEAGDLSARYQEDWMGFEINVLGNNFNQMIESLLGHMEEVKNERIAKELLANELKIGQEIQKELYPKEMPDFQGLDIAAKFLMAKEVGGDFYDLLVKTDTEGDHLIFTVADGAGKGISACLYALGLRSILRSYFESSETLSEVLQKTSALFYLDTADNGMFVTAWVGIYDAKKRLLHYSKCGHHPAILYRKNKEVIELGTPGIAIGVVPFEKVHTSSIELKPGDVLLLYTDGIVEAQNSKLEFFGLKRLMDTIKEKEDASAQELIDRILKEVSLFSSGMSQYDDLTLLAIRVL